MSRAYKASHSPELEHSAAIARSFEDFQWSQLSDVTLIANVQYRHGSEPSEATLRTAEEIQATNIHLPNDSFNFFFIHKHLIHDVTQPVPPDANKLRISRECFEALAVRLMMPPAFVFALSRHYLPNGHGSREFAPSGQRSAFDYWYILPVRVQLEADRSMPPSSSLPFTGGASQMNPFHNLHLPDLKLNIYRSCIGVFTRVQPDTGNVTAAVFDFMHGKWAKVALEPKGRIADVMRQKARFAPDSTMDDDGNGTPAGLNDPRYRDGAFIHLVYISSATRWWTNSLNSVNEQLIKYEMTLQAQLDTAQPTPEVTLTGLNRALHSVAAHLHRYSSELRMLQGIVADLASHCHRLKSADQAPPAWHQPSTAAFDQLRSQVEVLNDFAIELEKKTRNILALLFNRIQINSDRLLVENGQAMQAILRAMQEDTNIGRKMARSSHALAMEMRRESIAMRTIAVVTMFFLPAATFAAVLSMPFFANSAWLGRVERVWVWLLLTIPTTGLCFFVYRKCVQGVMSRNSPDQFALNSLEGQQT